MAFDKIAVNYEDVPIAGNELLTNIVLNRVFRKLFENDQNLLSKTMNVANGVYRILPWIEGRAYNKNELVWFVDCYLTDGNRELLEKEIEEYPAKHLMQKPTEKEIAKIKDKYYTVTLYLLRSLKNSNTSRPARTIVNMMPLFDASGWKNENPMGSIYTDYFQEFTADNINKKLEDMHQAAVNYHPFGELRDFDEIDEKVLRSDMQNIDSNRKKILFPEETKAVPETNSILGGSMRVWNCGLLEYDLTFKLGNSEYEYEYAAYADDGTLKLSEEVNANYMNLEKSAFAAATASDYSNRKYYLNDSDADIFVLSGGIDANFSGTVRQNNVNQKLNSYYGTIEFVSAFVDTNYSIFPTEIQMVADENGNIVKNENTLVFINKSRKSVTAMLVVPNYSQSEYKLLGENVFRCRITGRWK